MGYFLVMQVSKNFVWLPLSFSERGPGDEALRQSSKLRYFAATTTTFLPTFCPNSTSFFASFVLVFTSRMP